MLTHYHVIWKISGDEENTGVLDDVENAGLLGNKILSSNNYLTSHIGLNAGTTYKYTITAVSINDKIWRYKSNNMLNGRPVGQSNSFSINGTTKFTVPLKSPTLMRLNEQQDKLEFVIKKFPKGSEGGAIKGKNMAIIYKYKIKKYITNIDKTYTLKNTYIINLNNLSNSKIQVKDNNKSKEYTVTDFDIEPRTKYKYELYAMNNKVASWNKNFESIIMTTPVLNPEHVCNKVGRITISESLSTNYINTKLIKISWNKNIDPNIKRYQKFKNIYSPIYTHYIISITNKKNNTIISTYRTSNTSISKDNIISGETYKISIDVEHLGTLKLNNGYTDTITCVSDEATKIVFVKKLTQADCMKNIYSDTNSIKGANVYMDLDLNNNKCSKKTNKSLTKWCKSKHGNKYIYWPSTKKCVIPTDGKWIKELDSHNGPCTIDGEIGREIKCGGGKKIIRKWRYIKPTYGGKDAKHPLPSTTANLSDKNPDTIAYERLSCNIDKCDKLCEKKYGKYTGSENSKETLEEFNKNCNINATINSKVETSNDKLDKCYECGNPDSTYTKTTICTDGKWGHPDKIDCTRNKESGMTNSTPFTFYDIGGGNMVKQYSKNREEKCNIQWCNWEIGKWKRCNKICGNGIKTRNVTCSGICKPNSKPVTSSNCNNIPCKTLCEKKGSRYKWSAIKNSLTDHEFNGNNYCIKKNKIPPKIETSNNKSNKCPKCGNPNTTYTITKKCTNGLYGDKRLIDCKLNTNFNNVSGGWTYNGIAQIDGEVVSKYINKQHKKCGTKWCKWTSSGWNSCNASCNKTCNQTRNVYCNDGLCNSKEKPDTTRVHHGPKCFVLDPTGW